MKEIILVGSSGIRNYPLTEVTTKRLFQANDLKMITLELTP